MIFIDFKHFLIFNNFELKYYFHADFSNLPGAQYIFFSYQFRFLEQGNEKCSFFLTSQSVFCHHF